MSTIYTLVTGAGSGIGQRTAIQLSENRSIILNGRDVEKLKATLDLCNKRIEHFIWDYDLEKVEGIKDSLEEFLTKRQLTVDAYVHCAGIMKVLHMRNVDIKTTTQIFNVNLFSAIEIISLLLKKKING